MWNRIRVCGGSALHESRLYRNILSATAMRQSLCFFTEGNHNPRQQGRGSGGNNFRGEAAGGRRGGRGGGGGRGGRGAPRPPAAYLSTNAKELVQLKQEFKAAKSLQERVGIRATALRMLNGIRIDPSTQDERSVMTVLNCADTFDSKPNAAIEVALTWARRNLGALSPQNIALFGHAVAALRPPDAKNILLTDVWAATRGLLPDMTTVEVVMLLQAYSYVLRKDEVCEMEIVMLEQLLPCIGEMPVQQLSTLLEVLSHRRKGLEHKRPDLLKSSCESIFERLEKGTEKMHSNEVTRILCASLIRQAPASLVSRLFLREVEVVNFLTDTEVGTVMWATGMMNNAPVGGDTAVSEAVQKLLPALLERLQKVAHLAHTKTVSSALTGAALLRLTLPVELEEKLCYRVKVDLATKGMKVRKMEKLARSLMLYRCSSQQVAKTTLALVANAVTGKLPSRRYLKSDTNNSGEGQDPNGNGEEAGEDHFFKFPVHAEKHFAILFYINFYLQCAYVNNQLSAQVPAALSDTLPQMLLGAVSTASINDLLYCEECSLIGKRENVPDIQDIQSPRNKELNTAVRADVEELLAQIVQDVSLITTEKEANRHYLSHRSIERYLRIFGESQEHQNIVGLLNDINRKIEEKGVTQK
ncbi:mitochondrial oligoU binding protein TBRGG1 [Angomonas deanei]|nr:mitochondrial oligoU binding protein TBRGG1 [Angomonas deanei]|eukprot:EPY22448.1 mitochondrial oligoU binding protein TBRGG1 [Angomonas deanei]